MKTRFVSASLVLFLVVIVLFSVIPSALAPYHSNQSGITVSTDKSSYSEGDTIRISGSVSDYVSYDVTIQILNPLGKTVAVDEVEPSSDGTYSTNLLASRAVLKLDGTYTVKITHIVGTAKTTFEFLVSGVPPLGVNVVIPAGSSIPGCEETNECFLPYQVTINVGDRVTWTNMDSFFHTLASGTKEGPDGIFMSQMLIRGDRFSHTFTAVGNYVYFDMQNPWMTGVVIVGEAMAEEPMVTAPSLQIPDWIKNNAGWWAEGQIGNSDFVSGIQYMIKENIMVIPDLPEVDTQKLELKSEKRAMELERHKNVPDWVKNNAGWWANGLISEDDFVNGIKYLVEQGIIKV